MIKGLIMKFIILIFALFTLLFSKEAQITKDIFEVSIKKDGKEYTIKRNQEKIPKEYLNPLRGVIAPFKIDKDIQTIGELEVIDYFKKSENNSSIVIVDARGEDWYENMHIPSAINIPYTNFSSKENAIEMITFEFNVKEDKNAKLDFSNAKTLIIYCNGAWCAQSLQLIKDAKYSLIKLGYPKSKIKYYRGGMQSWVTLGLSTKKGN
jgi:rhodanese-related sulfurtransferase